MFANLHLHSTYSDCQFTPEQLLLIGKSLGYQAMSLTDHETDNGNKEFSSIAKKLGIETVSGVEFYGMEDGVNLHLTALDYDPDEAGIRGFIRERCALQAECTRKCVERGIRLGYIHNLTWNDILDLSPDGAWLCIDSVMRVMQIKKTVPADYDWTEFRNNVFKGPEVKSFHTAKASAYEVIKTVRKAGGVIALAHPKNQTHFVEKLVGYGLNGIEVCHPDLDVTQSALAEEAAEAFNLYRCGGTDHTGPMGGNGGKFAIPAFQGVSEEDFYCLKHRSLG